MEILTKTLVVIGCILLAFGVLRALTIIAFILKYSGNDELMNPDQDPPPKNQINNFKKLK